jgi:hypothetical protein
VFEWATGLRMTHDRWLADPVRVDRMIEVTRPQRRTP